MHVSVLMGVYALTSYKLWPLVIRKWNAFYQTHIRTLYKVKSARFCIDECLWCKPMLPACEYIYMFILCV